MRRGARIDALPPYICALGLPDCAGQRAGKKVSTQRRTWWPNRESFRWSVSVFVRLRRAPRWPIRGRLGRGHLNNFLEIFDM